MSNTTNNLEYRNSEIENGINEALQRNINAGLGKAGLGDVLSQEALDAKESGEIEKFDEFAEERIKTKEKYAGRNLAQEIYDLNIDESLPNEEKRQIIAKALDCRLDQISFDKDEALSGRDIVYHYGHLDLKYIKSADGLILPLSVDDYINLDGLKSAENLILPQSIGNNIWLRGLKSIKELDLSDFSIINNFIILSRVILAKYKAELEKKFPNLVEKFSWA